MRWKTCDPSTPTNLWPALRAFVQSEKFFGLREGGTDQYVSDIVVVVVVVVVVVADVVGGGNKSSCPT